MIDRTRDSSRRAVGRVLVILVLLGIGALPVASIAADGLSIKWSVKDDTSMGRPDDPDTKPGSLSTPVMTGIESTGWLDALAIPFFTITGQVFVFSIVVNAVDHEQTRYSLLSKEKERTR